MDTQGATQEVSSVNGTLWMMHERIFDWTPAFRNVLRRKKCGGFKLEGASRKEDSKYVTESSVSGCSKNIHWW